MLLLFSTLRLGSKEVKRNDKPIKTGLEKNELTQLVQRLQRYLDRIERVTQAKNEQEQSQAVVVREKDYTTLATIRPADENIPKADSLKWSWTLQSQQFARDGDSKLYCTLKCTVITSLKARLSPCAVAVTDKALYLCNLVDGKILHREVVTNFKAALMFTDRRCLGLRIQSSSNTLELYVQTDEFWHEEAIVKSLRIAEDNVIKQQLNAYIPKQSTELRLMLELDPIIVEELRQDLLVKDNEIERCRNLLQEERKKFQIEVDDVRKSETEQAAVRAQESFVELTKLRHARNISNTIIDEIESRSNKHYLEQNERSILVQHFIRDLQKQEYLWREWSEQKVSAERHQLVLACTATVEKSERAMAESEELRKRINLLQRITNPIAHIACAERISLRESEKRACIERDWGVFFVIAQQQKTRQSTDTWVEIQQKNEAITKKLHLQQKELVDINEKHSEASIGHQDATNRVGTLLRANKVLQQALGSCQFLDIHRVRTDSMLLTEDTNRKAIEVQAAVSFEQSVLKLVSQLLKDAGHLTTPLLSSIHSYARSAANDADAIARSGGGASDYSLRSLATTCGRVSSSIPKLQKEQQSAISFASSLIHSVASALNPDNLFGLSLFDDEDPTIQGGIYSTMEGWLHKHEQGTWTNRYFTFANGNLTQKSPNNNTTQLVLSIEGVCSAVSEPNKGEDYPNGKYGSYIWSLEMVSGERIKFSAPTISERQEWVNTVKEAITQHAKYSGRGNSQLTQSNKLVKKVQVSRSGSTSAWGSPSPSPTPPLRRSQSGNPSPQVSLGVPNFYLTSGPGPRVVPPHQDRSFSLPTPQKNEVSHPAPRIDTSIL
eukprot:TRINITY_DN713_c2_g1_i3.p1 TRINITY_DN713_c2_g1~~TRINITY_DN713_c2_g1_i3.p1  ORF type:complete len:837 (+),score=197.52 TRINITY_DN713_c2_g1_i3:1206-3716(+)